MNNNDTATQIALRSSLGALEARRREFDFAAGSFREMPSASGFIKLERAMNALQDAQQSVYDRRAEVRESERNSDSFTFPLQYALSFPSIDADSDEHGERCSNFNLNTEGERVIVASIAAAILNGAVVQPTDSKEWGELSQSCERAYGVTTEPSRHAVALAVLDVVNSVKSKLAA